MREEVLIMASVYDRSGRQVGEVTRSGIVYDVNQRRVGQVIGVGSVSAGGDLEDASGLHVGRAVGMNSVSVTADIYDRHDNYVGKVVGLRSVAGRCSIENRNGDDVGEVSTTHASAVGAALLLLPLVPGQAQKKKTVAVRRDAGGPVAARPDAGPSRPRAEHKPAPRPRRRRRHALVIALVSLLAAGGAATGAVVLLTSPSPQGSGNYVAVSPDGKFIAAAENDSVYLWDTASKRLTATLPDPHPATDGVVNALALNPDGTMLAVAYTYGPVLIWDTATRRIVATIAAGADASGLAFSTDGGTLAVCGNGNDVLLWDVAGRRVDATLHAVKSSVAGSPTAAVFSPDGKTLAVSISTSTDQNGHYLAPGIELWDLTIRRLTAALPGGSGGGGIAYSRDGRALAASEFNTSLSFSLWDVTGKPRLKATLSDLSGNAREYSPVGDEPVAFSPDGTTLATADGSPNHSAYLWDAATDQKTATLTDPNSLGVADLAYTPDGKLLITADGNGNLYLWQLASSTIVATLAKPS
jgi:WD40 repeat protein